MKKSVRINLLTITIVVALFVFAGLWFLRPGMSDEFIEQARLRQSQPLMEITPPVRTPRVESVSDISRLADEVKREIEPSLRASIRAELLADPALKPQAVDTEALKSELRSALRAELLSDPALHQTTVDTTALKRELQSSIKAELLADPALQAKPADTVAITRELQPILHGAIMRQLLASNDFLRNVSARVDISDMKTYVDRSVSTLSSTVDTKLDSYEQASEQRITELLTHPVTQAGLDPREVKLLIAEAVDEQLPMVVEQVIAAIEANQDVYIDVIRQALGAYISEDEVVDLYLGYRRDIVQDLVPPILDEIEDQVVDLYLGYRQDIIDDLAPPILSEIGGVSVAREETPAAKEEVHPTAVVPSAPVAVEKPQVDVVEEKPAVVTPPDPVVETPVVEVKPTPVVPSAPVVDTAPTVIKTGQPKIAPPTVTEVKVSPSATATEYEVERQRLRTEAIDEVLRRISQ